MDVELRRRLLMAAAELDLEEVDSRDAVMLACDLLADEASGPATLELAMQSPSTLHVNHAEVLLRQMLAEWHVTAPGATRSAALVADDLCRRLLAGSLAPEDVGHRLLGALAQADDKRRTDHLLTLLDRLEYDLGGRGDDVYRTALQALARDILADKPG